MSTRTKNISGKSVTPRIQKKSDEKVDSDRNVEKKTSSRSQSLASKEKTEKKTSTIGTNRNRSVSSKEEKEKEKTPRKDTKPQSFKRNEEKRKVSNTTKPLPKDFKQEKKPLGIKSKSVSSDRRPDGRVVKTQYFPSKNNYAEMLQHLSSYDMASGDSNTKKSSVLKKTPIISKSKTLSREESSESISTSERPRTSTLRKGSIVNENIAGPAVPKKPSPTVPPPTEEDEVEYEDDFDSYESDFENVSSSDSTSNNTDDIATENTTSSSSDEDLSNKATPTVDKDLERKLDSGNFDLKEERKRTEFSNLQDLVEKDNSRLKRPESNMKSNMTSLSDEGFEEAKSLQFLNFVSAKKRNERKKSMEMRKKRGEELMSMIKLDCVNFTVFDTPPVPYDEFIKTFGRVNSMQIGVQTGGENVEEEAQTEEIEICEKWSQMPPHVSADSPYPYKYERMGVGPALEKIQKENDLVEPQFNEVKLEKFMSNTGGLILNLLKEKEFQSDGLMKNKPGDDFSQATITFKPPSEFSTKRKITQVVSNPKNPFQFLSVHIDDDNDSYSKSMVYLWNINDTLPEIYMACYGKVTSCCFGIDSNSIFAGLQNGSLVVWETREKFAPVKQICPMIEGDVVLLCPTFLTDIEKSHCCPVVNIRCALESNFEDVFDQTESAWRVFSLDEEGTIIVWNIMSKQRLNVEQNGGIAYWGGIMMMKNFEVNLRNIIDDNDEVLCNDMFVSTTDWTSVFISTNYGTILQCELNKERSRIKKHTPEITSPVKCLVPCPFSDVYFLAGLENGSVLLYSRKNSKPLMVITNKESKDVEHSIEEIQWSLEKPCIFYTKNSGNIVDAWDLSKSSIFPIVSLSFEGGLTCMKLSTDKLKKPYMITSTETLIKVHLLNKEHTREDDDQYDKEMKTFLTYVGRL